VIEPDPDEVDGGIEDGEVLNPYGMDPATAVDLVLEQLALLQSSDANKPGGS